MTKLLLVVAHLTKQVYLSDGSHIYILENILAPHWECPDFKEQMIVTANALEWGYSTLSQNFLGNISDFVNIYEFSLISIYTNSDSIEIIISTPAPTVVNLYKKTHKLKDIFFIF